MSALEDKKTYQVAIKWKISERALKRASLDGRLLKTQQFDVDLFKCYIVLKPSNGKTSIAVQLIKRYRRDGFRKIDCDLSFTVESAQYANGLYQRIKCEETDAMSDKIFIDDLFCPEKKYIVNGEFTLKLKGCFTKMIPKIQSTLIRYQVREKNLWDDEYKDFTIVIDGKELQVHKIFLRASSPVFKAMFENENLKEARENKLTVIDFTYDIVEIGVKMCYGFFVPDSLTVPQAYKLLQFFDKYCIDTLKNKIEDFLFSRVDGSNVCTMANVSLLGNSKKLRERCIGYLQKCEQEELAVADFDELDSEIASKFDEESFFTVFETR